MDPLAMPLAINYGNKEPRPTLRRPRLQHCFSVWLDPQFAKNQEAEAEMIRKCLVTMIGMTNGDIGFEIDARADYDLRIVCDGERKNPNGTDEEWYSGLAYVDENANHEVVKAEVVLNPRYIYPKVVNHEIAHVLGFMHPDLSGSVMSDLDDWATQPAKIDHDAWLYAREHEAGTLRPGVERGQAMSFSAPRVIVN